jgi:glutathione S-transferase
MTPVLFYGVPEGCSFGSIVALEWLGQPYRLCRIDMLQHPWDARYARINPLFKTPALLTEAGEPISESVAILLHLAVRGGMRAGTPAFDRLTQHLAYLATDFFGSFSPLWSIYDDTTMAPAEKTVLRRIGSEDVTRQCRHLEALLADRHWLLGDERSVADAYLAGVGRWVRYHRLFDLDAAFPRLAAYLHRLADDPAVRFARAIEQGEAVAGNGAFQGHVDLEAVVPPVTAAA